MQNKFGRNGVAHFRRKRFRRCLELIENCYQEKGSVRIIDLGGTREYWQILPEEILEQKKIHITLVNNEAAGMAADNEYFSSLSADACSLSEFADNQFDIAHSNSVIEHVGSWESMECFAGEIRRLAPCYFVQTPNYWFPLEPHYMLPFYHWLPVYSQIRILGWRYKHKTFRESVISQERIKLLSATAFRTLFPDAELYRERLCLLTKSFVGIRK